MFKRTSIFILFLVMLVSLVSCAKPDSSDDSVEDTQTSTEHEEPQEAGESNETTSSTQDEPEPEEEEDLSQPLDSIVLLDEFGVKVTAVEYRVEHKYGLAYHTIHTVVENTNSEAVRLEPWFASVDGSWVEVTLDNYDLLSNSEKEGFITLWLEDLQNAGIENFKEIKFSFKLEEDYDDQIKYSQVYTLENGLDAPTPIEEKLTKVYEDENIKVSTLSYYEDGTESDGKVSYGYALVYLENKTDYVVLFSPIGGSINGVEYVSSAINEKVGPKTGLLTELSVRIAAIQAEDASVEKHNQLKPEKWITKLGIRRFDEETEFFVDQGNTQ